MQLHIKQEVFTLGERFEILDAYDQLVFTVGGSFMSFPKSFEIFDAQGQKVASITRQMMRLLPRYDIECIGNELVTIKRSLSLFGHSYELEGTDWYLKGDIFSHNYQVMRGERPVMILEKHWFSWGSRYDLLIEQEADALLALCISIVIDHEIERDSRNRNN